MVWLHLQTLGKTKNKARLLERLCAKVDDSHLGHRSQALKLELDFSRY